MAIFSANRTYFSTNKNIKNNYLFPVSSITFIKTFSNHPAIMRNLIAAARAPAAAVLTPSSIGWKWSLTDYKKGGKSNKNTNI